MFSMLKKYAARLDVRAFLGFRVWQFSLLNFRRAFPWYFLFRIILLHPIRSWKGLQRYRQLVKRANGGHIAGTTTLQSALLKKQENAASFLIAPGFCMKPYDYSKSRSICPAGHFNHACLLLDKGGITLFEPEKWPSPCSSCGIAPLVQLAAKHRADVYIMTSALDIARHVYLPAIRHRSPQAGLFFLCAYSTDAFTFGLALSGIEGALVKFCRGDCKNHEDWTKADIGFKRDQTFVESQTWQAILHNEDDIAVGDRTSGPIFEQRGQVYRVCEDKIANHTK